jgi:hypothetical protein
LNLLCFASSSAATAESRETVGKPSRKSSSVSPPFQVVEQGLDRHSRAAKHRSSAKNVPIFYYNFHHMIVPRARVEMPAAANRERVPRKLTIMIITDDLVETFLKCPTKCFFRSCGEVGAGNEGGRKKRRQKGRLAMSLTTPELFPEVADSVTCNGYGDCVSLLREPDASNPHVRFDERGVSRRREIVLLYER